MCGITGFIDTRKKSSSSEHTLGKMISAFRHRGPDDFGQAFFEDSKNLIGLGHARLSIIDLSPLGHQPMNYGNLTIIFNGEIYNYAEIKKELLDEGDRFISDSDTEVVLHAYQKWGRKCVQKFIGMFAFVLYDREKSELLICRDRAGVKPLFFYWHKGLFLFGSELKTFHQHPDFIKEINPNSVGMYFKYGYVPFPHCIFENCQKLEPGSWLIFDLKKGSFSQEKYWDVLEAYRQEILDISFDEAALELETLLKSACNYRMVADVPVGIFLSGGYDSTAVAAVLQSTRSDKLKTFTIGFEDDNYNEAPHAKKVAAHLGTDHTEYYCKYQEAKEIIPNLPFFYDEPFADSSAIPTTLVSRMAKKKVSVALSADAGDEIFFGYHKDHGIAKVHNMLSKIPAKMQKKTFRLFEKAFRLGSGFSPRARNLAVMFEELAESQSLLNPLMKGFGYFTRPDFLRKALLVPLDTKCSFDLPLDFNPVNSILALNYLTCLTDDMLVKVDRATMSCSLEGREPLLDHRLVEFAAQLPLEYKFDGKTMKKVLKEVVHKYVPRQIMDRPKAGFGIPIFNWLKEDLSFCLDDFCNPSMLKKHSIFNEEKVSEAIKNFRDGSNMQRSFIWQLLSFQMWYERWMK
jgi:asparagine synthase (glutamine-hydrolysing)